MNTYFDQAINQWGVVVQDTIEFGRLAILAIEKENKTIRDFSIALCGNASLEDRIGRYIMAAEFASSLDSTTLRNVEDWLTPSHFTELRKIEAVTDHATALDLMQELVTENHDGSIDVKPVSWLRSRRDNEEATTEEVIHRFWKSAARALREWQSVIERKGLLLTVRDKQKLALLKAAVRLFQSETEQP